MKGDQRRWPLKTVELFFILSGAFFINVTLERTDILIFLVHGSYRSTRSQWEFCGSNTLHNYFLNLFDLLVTSRLFKRSIPQWCVCPFFFVILSIYSYVHEVLWLDVYTFEIMYFWPTGPFNWPIFSPVMPYPAHHWICGRSILLGVELTLTLRNV